MKKFDEVRYHDLQEGLYDKHIFKAFFLAGGPGSGKTFVTRGAFGGTGLRVINSDTAFENALKKPHGSWCFFNAPPLVLPVGDLCLKLLPIWMGGGAAGRGMGPPGRAFWPALGGLGRR